MNGFSRVSPGPPPVVFPNSPLLEEEAMSALTFFWEQVKTSYNALEQFLLSLLGLVFSPVGYLVMGTVLVLLGLRRGWYSRAVNWLTAPPRPIPVYWVAATPPPAATVTGGNPDAQPEDPKATPPPESGITRRGGRSV